MAPEQKTVATLGLLKRKVPSHFCYTETVKAYVLNLHGGRILFEKLIFGQLIEKSPAFYAIERAHCRIHNNLSLVHILSYMNPAHIPTSLEVILTASSPSARRSPNQSLPFSFPDWHATRISQKTYAAAQIKLQFTHRISHMTMLHTNKFNRIGFNTLAANGHYM
jgi:hypothetical protein